jgi:hypothetical protein
MRKMGEKHAEVKMKIEENLVQLYDKGMLSLHVL